jgi:hypothetical protein
MVITPISPKKYYLGLWKRRKGNHYLSWGGQLTKSIQNCAEIKRRTILNNGRQYPWWTSHKEGWGKIFAQRKIKDFFCEVQMNWLLGNAITFNLGRSRTRGKKIEDFAGSETIPTEGTCWIIRKDGERLFFYNRSTSIEHRKSSAVFCHHWYDIMKIYTNCFRKPVNATPPPPPNIPGSHFLPINAGENTDMQCNLRRDYRQKIR